MTGVSAGDAPVGDHGTRSAPTPLSSGVLDFRPRPAAAPARSRIVRHAALEARLLLRNGEQLLLALVIPLGLLLLARLVGGRFGEPSVLVPSVLALALWSSTFTSTAIATGFERRYGVLERLAATPLGRSGLLAGKALAVGAIALGQLTVLALTGLLVGWRPEGGLLATVLALLTLVLAAAAFAGFALVLAGRLRAELTLALANLIYVLGLAAGLVVPLSVYPDAPATVLRVLPTGALGEGLRAYASGDLPWWPPVVLAGWALVAALLARKGFRWTS